MATVNNSDIYEEIQGVGEDLKNIHYLPTPIYKRLQKARALSLMKNNELEAIYYLVESHSPGLRYKTLLRNEKIVTSKESEQKILSKNNIEFPCTDKINKSDNIKWLVKSLIEMPKEWTIVQLTTQFHYIENVDVDPDIYRMSPLHISLFHCGEEVEPLCVTVGVPKDSVNGNDMELMQEMQNIITKNKETLKVTVARFKNFIEKNNYRTERASLDDRLKILIKEMQQFWLREWRCLLLGKLVDDKLEEKVNTFVKEFLKNNSITLTKKKVTLLTKIVKGNLYLKPVELKSALQYLFLEDNQKDLIVTFLLRLKELNNELQSAKRHPIILVLDDNLDLFPWEMLDVLNGQPVSRMPSLHFTYALYKEHELTIKDGYKIVKGSLNGSYLLNPDSDLNAMEKRLKNFMDYWMPQWKGIAGREPTEQEFLQFLQKSDVFLYAGHGNGVKYFAMEQIERNRIEAVVLLIGCSSTKLMRVGPQVEMYGIHQVYTIACSPCVVGMLWEVTDMDTDLFTTNFLSTWLSSSAEKHWKNVNQNEWISNGVVSWSGTSNIKKVPNEPDLLKAVAFCKSTSSANYFLTKSACVVRGIPTKLATK